MTQNNTNQELTLNPELIINNLLEQNKELTKNYAYQSAMSQQLQQESQTFLAYAQKVEKERDELQAQLEEANKKLANFAGPVPVSEAEQEPTETVVAE
ncbi:hypothetical protein LG275_03690 [Chryseomicrobium palamuruense]